MAKLKITQTRSTIGCLKNQIATMEALGLKKIRSVKIHEDNAVIRGMIDKVKHLVSVEEIQE
ncbi:MAG: 50S ribosomal protein L30 [Caldicoprobacterales bacterium]|jgi:large subunit ribosomal protein L30|nr:50S ribosomal protein L30 [Clostridiales bacterium]